MICKTRDYFRCSSSQCVPWIQVCDGKVHCDNGADEICDMCTNDLYTCKDTSVINCTMACTTLGYIPCINYMDKNACANVLKRHQSRIFDKHSNFSGNLSNGVLFWTILGFFTVIFIIGFLMFLMVHYKRSKRIRTKLPIRNPVKPNQHHNRGHNNSYSSETDSLEYNYPNIVWDDDKKSTIIVKKNNNDKIENFKVNSEHVMNQNGDKSNVLNSNNNNDIKQLTSSQELNDISLATSRDEIHDFHVYSDAPPSYKQAKYFPKADLTKNKVNNSNSDNELEPNVYENIEDVLENKSKNNHRKGKFQGLKKQHSSNKRQISQDSTESTELINGQRISSNKNQSSLINETVDI